MTKDIIPFRRIKHGLPTAKFKVLGEDIHSRPCRRRIAAGRFPLFAISIFAVVAIGLYLAAGGWEAVPRHLYDPACNIKGNIAVEDREKIYHLPMDDYYDEAFVSYLNGEQWFCSEEEAQAAGWRRARI